jgi:Ion channel
VHTDRVHTRDTAGTATAPGRTPSAPLDVELSEATELTRHRVRLLFPALVLVNIAYPISDGHPAAALSYAFAYVALLALGARVAAVSTTRQVLATVAAGAIALLSVPWVMFPDTLWLSLGVYGLLVGFHLLVIAAVARHLLHVRRNRDVLYAGTALYVLVGDLFVPAAMMVHLVTAQMTGAAAYGAEVPVAWQQMIYVSFTTLTTLGRDTLTPVTPAAQALSVAEATAGMVVLAVIIARLVVAEVTASAQRRA